MVSPRTGASRPHHRRSVVHDDPSSSNGCHDPLSVAVIRQLLVCPSGLEDQSRQFWWYHLRGERVGFHSRSSRGPRNDGNNGIVNMLVNHTGASRHYVDDATIPGLRDNLDSYQVLDMTRKNYNRLWGTTGRRCAGVVQWHRRRRQKSASLGPTLVFGCAWSRV